MEIIRKTIDKITVVVTANKTSKFYLNESNDIKTVDEDYLLQQISLLKSAKKQGIHEIKMKAVSDSEIKNIIKQDNLFIEKNAVKIKSGGIFTMLKNRGY